MWRQQWLRRAQTGENNDYLCDGDTGPGASSHCLMNHPDNQKGVGSCYLL